MRKVVIAVLVVVIGSGLGLGAAWGVGQLVRRPAWTAGPGMMGAYGRNGAARQGPGMMGGYGWNGTGRQGPGMMGGGMMGSWNYGSVSGQRLSLDQIQERAGQYATNTGQNLEVAEVMEFSNNFYAVIREKDTGRDAFEILLDPYSGAITAEPGPNMMWNAKYGHMGGWAGGDNTLSLAQVRDLAQKALDANVPGAKVHEDARVFYGYYTFDYDVNGQTAGMLSINGVTGASWLHTWHEQFIAEKELN